MDKTISGNGWLLITGDVGTGKTTLRRYVSGDYAIEKSFLTLNVTSWKNQGRSRVPTLMTRMIQNIAPDSPVPTDVELREERLRTLLLRLQQKQKKKSEEPKKIVLVIDSAQDISDATFRELKKLREIHSEPLFSILMFGNESPAMDNVLSGREVGYRCGYIELEHLDREEIIDFAERRFDISFESGKSGTTARALFCETVHPSPLGIEYFRSCLDELSGFKGVANRDLIRRASLVDLGLRMDKAKILISDITKEAKLSGIRLTTDEVSRVVSGKSNAPDERIQLIQNVTEKLIRKGS
ncbi:ATP-binding protein [Leptospira santarosai]|uniref:ATP-binding protein n=1 Tax=Leptospira santarosai TaxID=28183 RepID=UPI0030B9AFB0